MEQKKHSKHNYWGIAIALASLVLASWACSPAVIETSPNQAVPDSSAAAILVNNVGNSDICYLYISPSGSQDWGEELLGQQQAINAGQSVSLQVTAAGSYDLLAQDCSQNTLAEERNINISAGSPFRWDVGYPAAAGVQPNDPASETGTLTIVNTGSGEICYVYAAPASDSNYSADLLNDSKIEGGQSLVIEVTAGVTYDVRLDDCTQQPILEAQYSVAANQNEMVQAQTEAILATPVPGAASTAQLNITNNTGQIICYIYITTSGGNDWGNDLLGGSQQLQDGEQIAFQIDAGTLYDARADNCSQEPLAEEYQLQAPGGGSLDWQIGQ